MFRPGSSEQRPLKVEPPGSWIYGCTTNQDTILRTVCYPAFTDNLEIYPVNALCKHISKTANLKHIFNLVEGLGPPKPLFITLRKPFRRAKPGTLEHWIKDTLKQAGNDTDHSEVPAPHMHMPKEFQSMKSWKWPTVLPVVLLIGFIIAPVLMPLLLDWSSSHLTTGILNIV